MKKIIHSIRNKPDHVKTRLVFIFAAIATIVIVAIWIITLRLLKTSDDTIKTESPLKVFGQIFQDAKTDVKDKLNNPQENSVILNTDVKQDAVSGEVVGSDTLVLPEPILSTDAE